MDALSRNKEEQLIAMEQPIVERLNAVSMEKNLRDGNTDAFNHQMKGWVLLVRQASQHQGQAGVLRILKETPTLFLKAFFVHEEIEGTEMLSEANKEKLKRTFKALEEPEKEKMVANYCKQFANYPDPAAWADLPKAKAYDAFKTYYGMMGAALYIDFRMSDIYSRVNDMVDQAQLRLEIKDKDMMGDNDDMEGFDHPKKEEDLPDEIEDASFFKPKSSAEGASQAASEEFYEGSITLRRVGASSIDAFRENKSKVSLKSEPPQKENDSDFLNAEAMGEKEYPSLNRHGLENHHRDDEGLTAKVKKGM